MNTPIYNLNSIRPPITGIGRYALELIDGHLANDYPVLAVYGGQLYDGAPLGNLRRSLLQASPATGWNPRKLIGLLPYTRDLYRLLKNQQYRRLKPQSSQYSLIEHDVNYTNASADVVTLFDTSHLHARDSHPHHRVTFLDRYFGQINATSNRIITISESVKRELIEQCGFDAARIHVTPLAADPRYHPRNQSDCESVLAKYGLRYGQYVLSLATLEPRKNLARTIDAYLALESTLRSEFPLVVAGAPGWKTSTLADRIAALAKQGSLHSLGHVPEADLPALYAGSAVFSYASLYEGFGLPLLEAMQSGCACITSHTGALAEVSNGAALETDPRNVAKLTFAIHSLLTDKQLNLQYRQLATNRAHDFCWTNTVELTRDVYASI